MTPVNRFYTIMHSFARPSWKLLGFLMEHQPNLAKSWGKGAEQNRVPDWLLAACSSCQLTTSSHWYMNSCWGQREDTGCHSPTHSTGQEQYPKPQAQGVPQQPSGSRTEWFHRLNDVCYHAREKAPSLNLVWLTACKRQMGSVFSASLHNSPEQWNRCLSS